MSTETTIGDLPAADLDSGAAFVTGQAIESAATAIELRGRAKYVPAVAFLREFACLLYDLSTELSRAEGVEPMPLAAQEQEFDAAKKRRVN